MWYYSIAISVCVSEHAHNGLHKTGFIKASLMTLRTFIIFLTNTQSCTTKKTAMRLEVFIIPDEMYDV